MPAPDSQKPPSMVKQIKEAANCNADTIKALTRFVSKLKATVWQGPSLQFDYSA
jgi:hypothetical protein